MDTITQLFEYILHIDTFLIAFVTHYGIWTYFVLFLVIFCETGLVIAPFLPGDSLLFAAGSISANAHQALNIQILIITLIFASILGNKINYLIGRLIGPRVFSAKKFRFLNQKYLQEAHLFYETHGGKTIIIARFLPIIRTFAPFVAGIAYMNITQFSLFNIVSAVLWIGSLVGAGYFFGSLPFVKNHFSIVVYGVIALSLLPPLIAFFYRKIFSRQKYLNDPQN